METPDTINGNEFINFVYFHKYERSHNKLTNIQRIWTILKKS